MPTQVGDEVGVGQNATGEACRLRLIWQSTDKPPSQRYNLYCDGWATPSGDLRRFRLGADLTFERLMTESSWAKQMRELVEGCREAESTELLAGAAALSRECAHQAGGWPVILAVTAV